MRSYASPANAMTSVGLAAGFAAVLLAFEGRLGWAAAAIAVAAVLDLLDGPVARRAAEEDRFGAELDSLTDLLAFAVAPAVLLYEAAAGAPQAAVAAASLAYVMAGGWRLARFPLLQCKDTFTGLPTPPSGLLLVLAALLLPAAAAAAVAVALAWLMISMLPIPTFGGCVRGIGAARRRATAPAGAVGAPASAAVALTADREREPERPQRRRRRPALRVRVRVGRGGMVRVGRRARRLERARDELLAGADASD